MLRESMQAGGHEVDVRGVTQGFDPGVEIPQVAELMEFADAVFFGDATRIDGARTALGPKLGEAGLVDAAAVVAGFHGFTRVADAIGIPYTVAAQGRDAPDIRERAGVNQFYRVKHDAQSI